MLAKDIKPLMNAYSSIYESTDEDFLTDELIQEIVEELAEECIAFGYDLDESLEVIEEAAMEYLMELNPYAPAGSKEAKAYNKSTSATKRGEARKVAVKGAVERVKATVGGVKAAAGIAGSIAKDEVGRARRNVTHAVQKKKDQIKSGVRGLIGRGLRSVANRAGAGAKRLGEEVVDEAKAIGSAKSTDTNPKGAAVRASSGRGMTMTPAKGLGASKSTANNPAADDLRKKYFDKQAKEDRKSAAKDRAASGEDRVGKLIRSVQNSHYQPEDIYDLVLEYLMTGGHVDNLEEAHYIMTQLSDEYIQSVVEGVMPEPIDPVAHKTAQKTQKIYNLGKGTNNPNESQSALKRTGPQLPGV